MGASADDVKAGIQRHVVSTFGSAADPTIRYFLSTDGLRGVGSLGYITSDERVGEILVSYAQLRDAEVVRLVTAFRTKYGAPEPRADIPLPPANRPASESRWTAQGVLVETRLLASGEREGLPVWTFDARFTDPAFAAERTAGYPHRKHAPIRSAEEFNY